VPVRCVADKEDPPDAETIGYHTLELPVAHRMDLEGEILDAGNFPGPCDERGPVIGDRIAKRERHRQQPLV